MLWLLNPEEGDHDPSFTKNSLVSFAAVLPKIRIYRVLCSTWVLESGRAGMPRVDHAISLNFSLREWRGDGNVALRCPNSVGVVW